MGEKLGIGYIGLGDHSPSHVPFLNVTPLSETIGVADIASVSVDAVTDFADNPILDTHRDETSGEARACAAKDYSKLLKDRRVGAVVIATRDDTHYKIAKDAIEAGRHVLVEKPAAANATELAVLPELFDLAEEAGRRLWVCHPREFGDGPWGVAAQLIGDPKQISNKFETGPMGKLRALHHNCLYTVPSRQGLHASFADDKLNHTIVSVMRSLPSVVGFRDAVLHSTDESHFSARLVAVSDNSAEDGVVVHAGGQRTAHAEHHGGGVWRDWIEAVFDEGTLRVEPSLGQIALTYGKKDQTPLAFDAGKLYDDMFGAFNTAFVRAALDAKREEPLMARRVLLLGTAAAILMQQPGFDGEVSEAAVRRLRS